MKSETTEMSQDSGCDLICASTALNLGVLKRRKSSETIPISLDYKNQVSFQ